MVASAALFAAMGAGVKLAARELPNAMVVFFRNGVGLAVLLPLLLRKGLRGLHTRDVPGHIVRGLSGLASMYCFFYAIAHLRLADAVLLNQSVPLFIPLVGSLWLGERFPVRLWGVIGLGFAGILLILKPGTGLFTSVSLVGVSSAVLAAVAQVGIRRLTRTEPVTRIVFYFGLIGSVVSAVPAALAWRDPPGRAVHLRGPGVRGPPGLVDLEHPPRRPVRGRGGDGGGGRHPHAAEGAAARPRGGCGLG